MVERTPLGACALFGAGSPFSALVRFVAFFSFSSLLPAGLDWETRFEFREAGFTETCADMGTQFGQELRGDRRFFPGEVVLFAEVRGEVVEEGLTSVPVIEEFEVAFAERSLGVLDFNVMMPDHPRDRSLDGSCACVGEYRFPTAALDS